MVKRVPALEGVPRASLYTLSEAKRIPLKTIAPEAVYLCDLK
jgi:hypothetical protein